MHYYVVNMSNGLCGCDEDFIKKIENCCNSNEDYIINLVGKANLNEWNGGVTPQIFIDDIEIIDLMEGF